MKNKIIYGLVFTALIFTMGGCKKFLDVNKDPNTTASVPESLILPPIIADISTTIAGGSYSVQNASGIAVINSYWMQEISLNQPMPQVENYKLTTGDADNLFLDVYVTQLQNLNKLQTEAEANGNHSYGVIAKVLTAYTLGVATDMWGDVPFSDALNGNFRPTYDKQEDIYKTLQSMLDSAIAENQLATGNSVPSGDDFLYQGDMGKWEKFAYALKARYYIHLTKAPGYTAATQANLALGALAHAFTSVSDEASSNIYSGAANHESPWYENTALSAGGVVLSSTFINNEIATADPRLPIIADTGSLGTYLGRVISSDPATDVTIFSTIGAYYAASTAPVAILPYSELEFIKAEATFITSGAAAAQPIYQQAILDNMTKLGLSATDPGVLAYIASRGTLTSGNAVQRIIEEKSIADFLSVENFNDWRRTGFPSLSIVANPAAGITAIPRRYPYSQQEISSNPQPENKDVKITDRVWWDAAQ